MLDLAIKYEYELKKLFIDIAMDEEFMFFYPNSWRDSFSVEESTWNKHQFVSLNRKKEVVGYLKYNINRDTGSCDGLAVVNFKKDKLTRCFGNDLKQMIDDIFNKFKFNKLNFGVVVGNPAEAFYDKCIATMDGRIVGVYKQECKLLDGNYYDWKVYEVLREDYLKKVKNF